MEYVRINGVETPQYIIDGVPHITVEQLAECFGLTSPGAVNYQIRTLIPKKKMSLYSKVLSREQMNEIGFNIARTRGGVTLRTFWNINTVKLAKIKKYIIKSSSVEAYEDFIADYFTVLGKTIPPIAVMEKPCQEPEPVIAKVDDDEVLDLAIKIVADRKRMATYAEEIKALHGTIVQMSNFIAEICIAVDKWREAE